MGVCLCISVVVSLASSIRMKPVQFGHKLDLLNVLGTTPKFKLYICLIRYICLEIYMCFPPKIHYFVLNRTNHVSHLLVKGLFIHQLVILYLHWSVLILFEYYYLPLFTNHIFGNDISDISRLNTTTIITSVVIDCIQLVDLLSALHWRETVFMSSVWNRHRKSS